MTAAAIFAALQDALPVREVESYGDGFRVYLYTLPFKSEPPIAKRCREAGLAYGGRGWTAEKGQFIVVSRLKNVL